MALVCMAVNDCAVDEHVSATLAAGVTINHAVSMTVPMLGGLIWVAWGHGAVFVFAAGIALLMFLFSLMVRTDLPKPGVATPAP